MAGLAKNDYSEKDFHNLGGGGIIDSNLHLLTRFDHVCTMFEKQCRIVHDVRICFWVLKIKWIF